MSYLKCPHCHSDRFADDGRCLACGQITLVYRGWVTFGQFGENSHALGLEPSKRTERYPSLRVVPLAKQLEDDIDTYGNYLTVRYFITDHEAPRDQLEDNLVKKLVGAGDANYADRYSEITGYLWTDQDLNVGGHDLIAEFDSHQCRYAHLEVTFSKKPAA